MFTMEKLVEFPVAAVLLGMFNKVGVTVLAVDEASETVIPEVALVDGDAKSFLPPDKGAEVAVGKGDAAMGAFKRESKKNILFHGETSLS